MADQQPVGSDSLRSLSLGRTRDLTRYLATEITNLREGEREGYTASKTIVSAVIRQLDGLVAGPVASSPFMSPARRDSTKQFQQEMAAIVDREVNPAIRRYRNFSPGNISPKRARRSAYQQTLKAPTATAPV